MKTSVIALLVVLSTIVYADSSLSIVDQPSPTVTPGSTQTITWQTNYTLTKVRIELYKSSRFMAILGETAQNTRTFAWKVGSNAKYGSDYLVKVTVTASNGKSDWANTQTFTIGDDVTWNKNYLWFLVLLVLLCVLVCRERNNRRIRRVEDPLLPYATAVTTTNPVYVSGGGGGGGSTANGFAAGVAADELMHHAANRSSWFDSGGGGGGGGGGGWFGGGGGGGGGGGSWFGGGDFGVSDFGGGGGDSGGGVS